MSVGTIQEQNECWYNKRAEWVLAQQENRISAAKMKDEYKHGYSKRREQALEQWKNRMCFL